MPKKKPPFIRFYESFDRGKSEADCWNWTGSCSSNGKAYGQIKVFGKMVSAHRFSYELHNGPIPQGMSILHSCDNKKCVNPEHLRIGTHAENMREAADRGRMLKGENHPMWGVKNPRPKQAKKVVVFGVPYESQKSAERALGLGSGTIRFWINHKPHKAYLVRD